MDRTLEMIEDDMLSLFGKTTLLKAWISHFFTVMSLFPHRHIFLLSKIFLDYFNMLDLSILHFHLDF